MHKVAWLKYTNARLRSFFFSSSAQVIFIFTISNADTSLRIELYDRALLDIDRSEFALVKAIGKSVIKINDASHRRKRTDRIKQMSGEIWTNLEIWSESREFCST